MMTPSSAFDSDDDFIFGVDLSKLDVSEITEEIDASSSCNDNATSDDAPKQSIRIDKIILTTSLPTLEPAVDMNYDDLFEWATAEGARLEGLTCKGDTYGGTGLVSTTSFREGDVVAILPRALRIGQTAACQRLGLPSITPDLSALSLFLLDLLISDNEDDNFYHYAACLPRRGSNALFMSDNEIQYYGTFGENYAKAIKAVCDQEISCYEYIRDVLASIDFEHNISGLKWAISMVQSRAHGFGTNCSRWLTPVFDIANHSPSPNCKLEGDAQGQLLLRAIRCISIGEEVTIDYQVSEDAKLVATYGFSLKHPPSQPFGR
jgi:hypothetical protein